MVKTISLFVLLIPALFAHGQRDDSVLTFNRISYNSDGSISNSEQKHYRIDEHLDLEFYSEQFQRPHGLPALTIQETFKNRTIETWNDTTKAQNAEVNWVNTSVYDSLGRIEYYSYSGCFFCSNQSFQYHIFYDSLNKPLCMELRHLFYSTKQADEEYLLTYDNRDRIIRMTILKQGKLKETIELAD